MIPTGWELVLVVIVIMVLFGAKRLPDASRSLGRSLRIFKAETKGLRDDDETTHTASHEATYAPTPVPPPSPVVPPVPQASTPEQAQQRQP